MTVLTVLESTLPSVCLFYKIQHNDATVAVLTVLAVSAVMAVSVMTAPPLNSTPLFRGPDLQRSPEQLMATKDKKDKISEFSSPGASGVSREVGQNFKHCKNAEILKVARLQSEFCTKDFF